MDKMNSLKSMETELDSLVADMQQTEGTLLLQIDQLAEEIPEIYAGYASMVRTLVTSAMDMMKPGSKVANKMAMALEIGARSIQAFGEYKAAKEHNRLVQKYMTVKKIYAQNNLEKVTAIMPKVTQNAATAGRLFKKCSEVTYRLADLDVDKMRRVASLQSKALTMYRTNAYLFELCKYLKNEYGTWLNGLQRSEFDIPDYYLINNIIAKELFPKPLIEAYSEAADAAQSIMGKEIMLLTDYQLTFMALGQKVCHIRLDDAQPLVRTLINDSGAVEEYNSITKPYTDHLKSSPTGKIVFLGIIAVAVIIAIAFLYFQGSIGEKFLLAAVGLGATLRICIKGNKKALIQYVQDGRILEDEADRQIESLCGKVERPDIDYNERNAITSAITGFFK
ncbi:MAG: hypothetical protein K2L45_00920 [Muribaculaceae bacterium]|nr:hypothetical protein [Muribaculaceae bacterium]